MSEIRDPDDPHDPHIVTATCGRCEALMGWDDRDASDPICLECEVVTLRQRLRAVEEERDKFKRHLEECHTRASQAEAEAGRLQAQLAAATQREEALREALDGTHFHHKAFEPLCRHCQVAYAALLDVAEPRTPPPGHA